MLEVLAAVKNRFTKTDRLGNNVPHVATRCQLKRGFYAVLPSTVAPLSPLTSPDP
jgi:hypothetical protein